MKDGAIEHYQSLVPSRYEYIDKLIIYQDTSEDGYSSYTSLELRLMGATDNCTLLLTFYEVIELKINFTRGYNQLPLLSISSMRDRQWESVDYAVCDDCNQLSFYCKRFDAVLVEESVLE